MSTVGRQLVPSSEADNPVCVQTIQETDEDDDELTSASDPMSRTIVIHPGSRWLRIGRASDAFPITIPNIIATKSSPSSSTSKGKGKAAEASLPTPTPVYATRFSNTAVAAAVGDIEMDQDDDEEPIPLDDDTDPVSAKINSIRGDLRARMRIFKLRGQGNGNAQAAAYNETVVPENLPDYNDPSEIEWTDTVAEPKDFYVGEKVRLNSISSLPRARD